MSPTAINLGGAPPCIRTLRRASPWTSHRFYPPPSPPHSGTMASACMLLLAASCCWASLMGARGDEASFETSFETRALDYPSKTQEEKKLVRD